MLVTSGNLGDRIRPLALAAHRHRGLRVIDAETHETIDFSNRGGGAGAAEPGRGRSRTRARCRSQSPRRRSCTRCRPSRRRQPGCRPRRRSQRHPSRPRRWLRRSRCHRSPSCRRLPTCRPSPGRPCPCPCRAGAGAARARAARATHAARAARAARAAHARAARTGAPHRTPASTAARASRGAPFVPGMRSTRPVRRSPSRPCLLRQTHRALPPALAHRFRHCAISGSGGTRVVEPKERHHVLRNEQRIRGAVIATDGLESVEHQIPAGVVPLLLRRLMRPQGQSSVRLLRGIGAEAQQIDVLLPRTPPCSNS